MAKKPVIIIKGCITNIISIFILCSMASYQICITTNKNNQTVTVKKFLTINLFSILVRALYGYFLLATTLFRAMNKLNLKQRKTSMKMLKPERKIVKIGGREVKSQI